MKRHKTTLSTIQIALAIFVWVGASAAATSPSESPSRGWRAEYISPCVCDGSLREAFPKLFANRLPQDQEAHFLEVATDLIDGFVKAPGATPSQKYIYWSVYEFNAYDIVNALIRASQAGVNVQVVTDGKSVVMPPEDASPQVAATPQNDRNFLTRDVYKVLVDAGISVVYSNPEFKPISTSFPPIMHEKIRLFAVKNDAGITPVVGYVSTHNDTFSDTIGDPIASLSLDRIRQGQLSRSDLDPYSRGNVQNSFIVRHAGMLALLMKNFNDQYKLYGKGTGRIANVPQRDPAHFELGDGSHVTIAFTYGQRESAYNPNQELSDFVDELSSLGGTQSNVQSAPQINLQEFVFSYDKARDSLKNLVATNTDARIDVMIDGNFAYQSYSEGRPMSGLYTVRNGRTSNQIEMPWDSEARRSVKTYAYVNGADKLHSKSAWVHYKDAAGSDRFRMFTGSLNLSANGVSNKEVIFEIDSPSRDFVDILGAQNSYLLSSDPSVRPLAEAALFSRINSTLRAWGGKSAPRSRENLQKYSEFLAMLGARTLDSRLNLFSNESDLTNPLAALAGRASWIAEFSKFLTSVSAGDTVVQKVVDDVSKNFAAARSFEPNLANVEVLLVLTDDVKTIKPATRNAVLDLFR